jgi:hypothetical protein
MSVVFRIYVTSVASFMSAWPSAGETGLFQRVRAVFG